MMMEFEYSPRHSPGNAAHLLSPGHAHGSTIDGYTSIQQIRRSLSKSPSKPGRYSVPTTRAASSSPTASHSPSSLSRAHSAGPATDPVTRPKYAIKRTGSVRTVSRRTSPNSPLRRALNDNTSQANANIRITREMVTEAGQENMDCSGDASAQGSVSPLEDPKLDFLRPAKLLQPVKRQSISPVRSSPLKRSDGVMNLEAATFGNPRAKRRSLHGASLGSDFNIFDQGFDGTQSDSTDSSEERDIHGGAFLFTTMSTPNANSPQRRPLSLRKSTLQQRTATGRPKHVPESARDSHLSPSLPRARSRISLDSALPLRFDLKSPFSQSSASEPPVLFVPPGQRPYQSAPKPHPLSHALTPSSSASSVHDDQTQPQTSFPSVTHRAEGMVQSSGFSKSLPVGAMRSDSSDGTHSGQGSSQGSYATPEGYKMAKPLPQAFMSTGLISKRNRNMDMQPASLFSSVNMPDTPSKKAHVIITPSPAPASILGGVSHPTHEFGSPSTPFNAKTSWVSPESLGKGINIFGSRVGAPQLTRRGSFISIDGEDVDCSPTHQMDSQSSNDDLPPTPTKSNSINARPQSKGKSNSLRSSLFGRRTSIGPDTFASPTETAAAAEDINQSEYLLPAQTPCARMEKVLLPAVDVSPAPYITLTACTSPSPSLGRSRSLPNEQMPTSPSPLARRAFKSLLFGRPNDIMYTKGSVFAADIPEMGQETVPKRSPRTPHESFAPPDPSSLSISAERRQAAPLTSSVTFPPATPTGPRDHLFNGSLAQGHASSNYFSNDVDTALTSRFGQVATLGVGEFSQVYRVENSFATSFNQIPRVVHPANNVWAVKKSRKPYTGNKDRHRKMREVQILKALRGHEHLVELVDNWEFKNHLYIQLEFCENGNLKDFLTQAGFKGRLDDFRIWKILLELSQGVKSIHDSGFIHLDLKPANVFIDWEGVLKIGDFGLASTWPAPAGIDGEGDREYIGPEVLSGRFDKPADVFSLGMIMLEIAGNIILPDNGTSWQRLRAGDMSDLPSLTSSSDSSLTRDDSGEPVEMMKGTSHDILSVSNSGDDDLSFLRPAVPKTERSGDLVQPPNFMIDSNDPEALDRVVQWMICPDPDRRPVVDQLLGAGGVQWVEQRRRAGATVYEGNWGPADIVLNHEQDVEMVDI